MKKTYTKKQIQEAINHWEKQINESNDIPAISSISEFLALCKDRGIKVEKKKIAKQGKIVSAYIADKDEEITSREGKETAKKGSLVVDDGDNTFYAVQPNNIKKYYEIDAKGNSITGDNTKWKKIGKTLEYYVAPFDVDVKVSWQKDPLHATKGYSLVCNDKDGKDISPIAPKVFKDKSLWKPIDESKICTKTKNMKKTYTKKQITEAIAHWTKILEGMKNEDSLNEVSYGGEAGVSPSDPHPPTQEELMKEIVDASDEDNADMFIDIIRNLEYISNKKKDDSFKRLLMNLEDPAMLADFLRTIIGSMSTKTYAEAVETLYY